MMDLDDIFSSSKSAPPSFKEISETWDSDIFDSMFEEWWRCLQERNVANTVVRANVSGVPFYIVQPEIVEVIFRIASRLRQDPSVRYLAVELFDKFVGNHFKTLYDSIWRKSFKRPLRMCEERWARVSKRLKSQALLRILSCIQLASKFVSNAHIVGNNAIVQCLYQFNLKYSMQSVRTSEKRVFNTIKCKIPVYSTLKYIEHLVQSLHGIVNDLDILYTMCIKVFDVTTALHHQIYKRLFHMMTTKWEGTTKERDDFIKLECDTIHVSSAVVAAAAMISDGFTYPVLAKLSLMSGLPVRDIEGIAAIIIDVTLVT